jgi:predicted transcriptional regulator
LGREVQRGSVIYIAGEGSAGLPPRVKAWKRAHGFVGRADVHFLTTAVPLLEREAADDFLRAIRERLHGRQPVLIVLDTLARSMVGGDENSGRDMSLFVAATDRLREATGATVLVVHHTGRKGESPRGHSALDGAVDTQLLLSGSHASLTLKCEKQKDSEEFQSLALRLVALPDESCVITGGEPRAPGEPGPKHQAILRTLAASFADEGAPSERLRIVAGLAKRPFYDAMPELVAAGLVEKRGENRGVRYLLTEQGREAIAGRGGEERSQSHIGLASVS